MGSLLGAGGGGGGSTGSKPVGRTASHGERSGATGSDIVDSSLIMARTPMPTPRVGTLYRGRPCIADGMASPFILRAHARKPHTRLGVLRGLGTTQFFPGSKISVISNINFREMIEVDGDQTPTAGRSTTTAPQQHVMRRTCTPAKPGENSLNSEDWSQNVSPTQTGKRSEGESLDCCNGQRPKHVASRRKLCISSAV